MDNKKTPITPRKRALAGPTPFRHQQGRLLLNSIARERVCFFTGASVGRERWQCHHRSTFSARGASPAQLVCASSIFDKIDLPSLVFMIFPENAGFLADQRILVPDGQGRATSYRLAGTEAVDLASTVDLESPPARSEDLTPRSEHLAPSSSHLEPSSSHLDPQQDPRLRGIAVEVRNTGKIDPLITQRAILELCRGRFLTVVDLAFLLNRSSRGLRDRFVKPLIEEGLLERRFPQQPNHEQQAYRTREP